MFDHYSKQQPLHVIHTPDGEVYQAHPKTGQLMDRHDEDVIGEIEGGESYVPHKHAEHISKALDHIPGGGILKVDKEFPNVTHKDLDSVISIPEEDANDSYNTIKSALTHPNITPDLLEKAFNNHSFYIKQDVLRNPKTPTHVIKHAIENVNHWGVKYVAMSNPSLGGNDIRKYYIGRQDQDLRGALLSNPSAPKDLFKDAIDLGTPSDVNHAMKNPKADADMLRYGVSKHPHQVYKALENPNAPPDIIDKGLIDKGWENAYGQQLAAEHPNATPENLHNALKSKVVAVRAAAVEHPRFNESHLKVALHDNDHFVVGKALRHPLITSEHLHDVIAKSNGEVHPMISKLVYSHPKLSDSDLENALNSSDPHTVRTATKNKNSRGNK
jgi:hypothetical protein